MFWSKIWFFLVAVLAAVTLTIALVLPRPAERQRAADEQRRIINACDVANILLYTNARSRIDLAGKFARSEADLGSILGPATMTSEISPEAYKTARTAALQLIDSTAGHKPGILVLLDGKGRVVARMGYQEKLYGDTLAGNALVDATLAGYLRDDLWVIDNELFLVAGSPVINNGYAGAIVVGHKLDNELAKQLAAQLGADMSFYAAGSIMAASDTAAVHRDIQKAFASTSGNVDTPLADDCRTFQPFTVSVSDGQFTALTARLPGAAGAQGGFFAVFVPQPAALGLMGTLDAVTQSDLSFSNFPWFLLGGGFVVMVALGMGIMVLENDRPLRRLASNAVQLAKGDLDRLDEERHRGKFGSIARSVNIYIDRARREARTGQNELSDLLGPVSNPAISPVSGAAISPPAAALAPPSKPPPPSAFKFSDQGSTPPPPPPGRAGQSLPLTPPRAPTSLPGGLPPRPGSVTGSGAIPRPGSVTGSGATFQTGRTGVPVRMRPSSTAEISINEDSGVFGGDVPTRVGDPAQMLRAGGGPADSEESVFHRVFDEFVALKQRCGEPTGNLTYEKFAVKLRTNKQALMAKHDCREVHFQVYVKNGKAALKATPIKD